MPWSHSQATEARSDVTERWTHLHEHLTYTRKRLRHWGSLQALSTSHATTQGSCLGSELFVGIWFLKIKIDLHYISIDSDNSHQKFCNFFKQHWNNSTSFKYSHSTMKIFHTNIYLHTNTLKFVKRVSTPVVVWLEIVSLLWICMHTFGEIKLLKFRIFKPKKVHRGSNSWRERLKKKTNKQTKKKHPIYQGTSSRCRFNIFCEPLICGK